MHCLMPCAYACALLPCPWVGMPCTLVPARVGCPYRLPLRLPGLALLPV